MRFKEGDYVKVRSWKDMQNEFGLNIYGNIPCQYIFVAGVKHLCGQILYIRSVRFNTYLLTQSSSGEFINYNFSDDMLELRTYSKEEFEQQESTR